MSGAYPLTITFLSDYGQQDEFVGVCHGVIARRCPAARVIDITHGIPRHDVRAGALVLAGSLPYTPAGVHLAVVDPGVGGSRRALALRVAAEERLLVGPDNGLLMLASERLGGALEAVEISASRERLEPVSHTFHGRDLFAPVAAALAAGEVLGSLGSPLAVDELVALQLPLAQLREGELVVRVLHVDGFGNLLLDATPGQLDALGVHDGETVQLRHRGRALEALRGRAFGDAPPGEPLLYEDSLGVLALAVNEGDAAKLLAAHRDDELVLVPA